MITKLGMGNQSCSLSILQAEAGGLLAWTIDLGPLLKGQEREEGAILKIL